MHIRDSQGCLLFLKRFLGLLLGWASYLSLFWRNQLKFSGLEHLAGLPDTHVLFVSNHETYYMDVMAWMHGLTRFRQPRAYLKWLPALGDAYFLSATETMFESGFLPRIFAYMGAVTVQRTWRAGDTSMRRPVRPEDLEKIRRALTGGWLITFPQGTTRPYAQGRIGTAKLIQAHRPVVVPVVLRGFREAFHKSKPFVGLRENVSLRMEFRRSLEIDYNAEAEQILEQVMDAIEQSARFDPTRGASDQSAASPRPRSRVPAAARV